MRRILFLAAMALFCSVEAQSVVDSLVKELQLHSERDTIRAMTLNRLSYFTSDPQQSKIYADEALAISEEQDFKKGIAHAYYQLSQYYWKKTDSDKSIEYAFKALRLFEVYMPRGVSVCYSMIGINLAEQNNIDEAIRYHRLALALNTKSNNIDRMSSDYINIGNVYHDNKRNFDSALYYYHKSLDLVRMVDDSSSLMLVYNNLGSAYSLKGEHARGLDYLLKAYPIAEVLQNEDRLALINQTLGEIYARMNRYEEATKHFGLSLKIANQIGNKRRKVEVYGHLRDMERSRGDYKQAFEYLSQLTLLKDTVYNLERSGQIAEIQTQYETEKKAQLIKTLEQEKQIQNLWRNILIAGVVFLVAVSYIIYQLQRYRTERAQELLEAQRQLNEKQSAIDKLKSQLYNNVAHEFRTPLTLILAPIENELKKASNGSNENLLLMKRSATRLLDLINQLLDLSKLESGKMSLRITEGDLTEFFKQLIAPFQILAQQKKIEFISTVQLPKQSYWFDSDALDKIISNLLSNALKFTAAEGKVTIDITSISNKKVSISIADTGTGIPLAEQQNIFSPFYQVPPTTSTRQPGTGLGLSLVKELVRLYNGTISVTSNPGVGSTFKIMLPVNQDAFESAFVLTETPEYQFNIERFEQDSDEERDQIEADNATHSGDSILVVEDNTDLRTFISDTLRKGGYQVVAASDGKDGLAHAQQFIPNLVLSDVMMPIMDGIEMTRLLKTDERTSHIPVILLTAKNEHTSRLDGLRTGADDYLTKPFSPEELLVRIQNLIEQRKKLSQIFRERISVKPATTETLSLDDKFLLNARNVVEANISDHTMSVDRLTQELNLSRTQLFRKMKALTGFSPNDFIKNIRMQRAAEMIRMKTDTITQIGYAVGFNDQSYFTKCFKKQFGVTPSEYAGDI